MKEAYVTYETSKLLKEKGFDWFTYTYYTKDDVDEKPYFGMENLCPDNWNGEVDEVNDLWFSAPTQQMACRWLREVHNIFIGVGIGEDLDGEFGYMPFIHILDNLSCPDGKYVPDVDADGICDLTPQTYEDAVEAALQYTLTNLI